MACVKNLKTGVQSCVTHSIFLLKFSPTTVCENRSQTRKKLADPTTTKQENVTDTACQSQPKKYVKLLKPMIYSGTYEFIAYRAVSKYIMCTYQILQSIQRQLELFSIFKTWQINT